MADRRYLNQVEAAELLRVSARALEKWRQRGSGPAFIRANRRVVYALGDLEAWLASGRRHSTTSAPGEVRQVAAGSRRSRAEASGAGEAS